MDVNSNVENVVEIKSLFTTKKIMRLLSLLCVGFVFCPVFLVSCSGREIEVDVMTAVGGMSMYGETVVEPHPIMLICLLIPIAVLVMLFVNKLKSKKIATCSLVCMLVDFVVWIIFKSTVEQLAEENYCTFETTGWFYANMISMALVISLSLLVVIRIIEMDTDLIKLVAGSRKQEKTIKVNNRIGFCVKCGTSILYGCKFCTYCGAEVPSSVLDEAKKEET